MDYTENKKVTSTMIENFLNNNEKTKEIKQNKKKKLYNKMISFLNSNPTFKEIVQDYTNSFNLGNKKKETQLYYIIQLLAICNASIDLLD